MDVRVLVEKNKLVQTVMVLDKFNKSSETLSSDKYKHLYVPIAKVQDRKLSKPVMDVEDLV
jgi:hypothetical protein